VSVPSLPLAGLRPARPAAAAAGATRLRLERADLAALAILVALTVAAQAPALADPLKQLSGDVVLFFIPMFHFLGEQLRAGNVPGWNPHQFAGAPFAADPQSGWAYAPVMVFFSLLPLAAAIPALILFHLLLAGIGAYAFARLLGLNPAGALAAGVIFEFTTVWERAKCCPQIVHVVSWLPLTLICAEMALRARDPLPRLGWWFGCGFAVSQVLAAWLGQGSYYQLLVLAGWIAYRTLFVPAVPRPWLRRLLAMVVHGAAVLLIGLAFDAAALIPRLEFNAVTNVAGGVYQGDEAAWAGDFGGWDLSGMVTYLFGSYSIGEWWYAGVAAAVVAAIAPLVARRWFAWPFFVAAIAVMLVLALPEPTPVHRLAFLVLPAFEVIHGHYSHRITYAITLPIAMLAGATVSAIPAWRPRWSVVAVAGAVVAGVVALALGADARGAPPLISPQGQATAIAAAMLLLLGQLGGGAARRLLPAALIALFVWDPAGRALSAGGALNVTDAPVGVAEYARADGAAGFIASYEPGPVRYFGFDPVRLGPELSLRGTYLASMRTPEGRALLLGGNRATLLGIDDLQGYNPVHPMRYVEFVRALNGHPQVYRFANVYPGGLDSPLLDLLNARLAVVPPADAKGRPAVAELAESWPERYEDGDARVLENPEAFPRAWLVHEARVVARGEALEPLASGAVDGRATALVEDPQAALPPTAGATGSLRLERPSPDEIRLHASSDAPALAVVSEVYDRGWRATVDGNPAPVHVANHTLMAVPVPAGDHVVALRYDPPSLRIGIAISAATGGAALAVWAACALRRRPGRPA